MRFTKMTLLFFVSFALFLTTFSGSNSFITTTSENIKPGSPAGDVRDMQQRLSNWGYYEGNIDGDYGMATLLAVKNFQEVYRLRPSGIADRQTQWYMGMTRLGREGTAYAAGKGTSDEQLLARAINGEARGEPYEGQVAVGAVILNRTKDSKFPKTIAGVIYQPGAFTAVADGQINVAIKSGSTIVKAARDALNGWDPTSGCIYYWNPATATSKWIWSRKVLKKIGKHNFAK